MKIKQQVVIRDPDAFLKGVFDRCFTLYGLDCRFIPDDWIKCGEIEFDVDIDSVDIIQVVSDAIKNEIRQETEIHYAKITVLENRLSELLALEAPKEDIVLDKWDVTEDEYHKGERI